MKKRLCKICHQEPAKVPDRFNIRYSRYGPINEICLLCLAERLRGDLNEILKMSRPQRVRATEIDRDFPEPVTVDVDLDRGTGQQ